VDALLNAAQWANTERQPGLDLKLGVNP